MYTPVRLPPIPQAKIQEVRQIYLAICRQFLAAYPQHSFRGYIESSIANDATLDRHIRAFELYAPYVTPAMKILDWGCRQAPDSCLLRALHPELELQGCDFMEADFSAFHRYAQLRFEPIRHNYQLPYAEQTFDAVVGSGVLEHVPFEHETLREIWRVLREGGFFFITFLPNRFSLSENAARWMGNVRGHSRLYDLEAARNVFLRSGFFVERCGYHQVFPTFAKAFESQTVLNPLANVGARLNRTFEKIPPVNWISSNLFFILRKVRFL